MSTPHPIKLRNELHRPPQKRRTSLQRSRSAPDLHSRRHSTKRPTSVFSAVTAQVGEIVLTSPQQDNMITSDTDSSDGMSVGSRRSSQSTIPNFEDLFEEEPLTYVEALWDHVTMEPDELAFHAGDVIDVTDMLDKDWWWGQHDDLEGWFPSAFVRLRVNQEETHEDVAQKVRDGTIDTKTAMRRISSSFITKDQARSNVVNEIINAERDYVRHLKDIVEGYIYHARKRPEMFSQERLSLIYSNCEQIYKFSQSFLETLEMCYLADHPHLSQLGTAFLDHRNEFEIYSEYCNNHPAASVEMAELRKQSKYQQFFEACRLLQEMIEIPLEGFLLTPVQKICKYPLQLAELLKYTHSTHQDYPHVKEALEAMRGIANLINERKRKMESIEKIALWQNSVEDWEGPDLLDNSSELIYQGELCKVTLSSGWAKERMFFLFDHQLIYCKKDLLKRNILIYNGRINMDNCDVIPIEDGKDSQFNLNSRNGWKLYDRDNDKWLMLYARTAQEKTRWLQALTNERKRVQEDSEAGFVVPNNTRDKILHNLRHKPRQDKPSPEKGKPRRVSQMPFPYQHQFIKELPGSLSLPQGVSSTTNNNSFSGRPKKTWSLFGNKKSKR